MTVCVHSPPLQNWRNDGDGEKLSAKRHQGHREIRRQGGRGMLADEDEEGLMCWKEGITERL